MRAHRAFWTFVEGVGTPFCRLFAQEQRDAARDSKFLLEKHGRALRTAWLNLPPGECERRMVATPDVEYDAFLLLLGAKANADARRGIADSRAERYLAPVPGHVASQGEHRARELPPGDAPGEDEGIKEAYGSAARELDRLRKKYARTRFDCALADANVEGISEALPLVEAAVSVGIAAARSTGIPEAQVESVFASLVSLVLQMGSEAARRRMYTDQELIDADESTRDSYRRIRTNYARVRESCGELAQKLGVSHPDRQLLCHGFEFPPGLAEKHNAAANTATSDEDVVADEATESEKNVSELEQAKEKNANEKDAATKPKNAIGKEHDAEEQESDEEERATEKASTEQAAADENEVAPETQAAAVDEPAAPETQAAAVDEPAAPETQAAAVDEPAAPETQAAAVDEPAAPETQAAAAETQAAAVDEPAAAGTQEKNAEESAEEKSKSKRARKRTGSPHTMDDYHDGVAGNLRSRKRANTKK